MRDDYEDLDVGMVAERLKHEMALFHVAEKAFAETSEKRKTYPRKFEGLKTRTVMKEVRHGLKIIKKKNPLYIEMPTLKEVGNGQVKKIYDEKYKDKPDIDEVVCYDTHVSLDNSEDVNNISDSEAKAGFIEDSK